MKTLSRRMIAPVLILIGVMASTTALADRNGHGYARGHAQSGNVRLGISIGVPVYAPHHYPARHHSYPTYIYPAAVYSYPAPVYVYPAAAIRYTPAPVYIEREVIQAQAAPAQSQGDWYYCAESGAYYPYVAQCAAGWQRVPAQAAPR